MTSSLPDTLIRLSTLAEKTGLSVHCIRTYVDQGLIQVSDRTQGGLLLFNEVAVKRLRFIKTARDPGVPLAKIACLLSTHDQGDEEATSSGLRELNHYIEDIRHKMNAFEQSLLTFSVIDSCCLGLPVVLSALTAIGLGFLIHDVILIPLFIAFISFNLWMLNRSVNKQEACASDTMIPFNLAAIGGAISILGLLLSVAGIGLATLLIYIGLGLFFVGNYRGYKGNSDAC